MEIIWIEHSLHDEPIKLNMKIKEKIREAEDTLEPGNTILLFFGNCGGALEGIQSETLNLIYPDVHDCIPILIGSVDKFGKLHTERPGTFYLNKAWIDSGNGPLGTYKKYINIYGEEKGWRVAKKMYKGYTHFALINNGCYDLEPYRKHVHEACKLFNKTYLEEKGTLDFVKEIIANQCRMRRIPAGG